MKDKILDFVVNNWPILAPILWEVLARVIPTERSASLINFLKKVTDVVIPNLKKNPIDGNITRHE